MLTYYCQTCAVQQGLIRPQIPPNVFLTPYQVQKYEKHTRPSSLSPKNGVFTDPSTLGYRAVMATAAASGWFETDPSRFPSLVRTIDPPPGLIYEYGQFHASANAVRLVLPNDPNHFHLYPEFVPGLEQRTCAGCGVRLDVIVCGYQAEGDRRTFTSSG